MKLLKKIEIWLGLREPRWWDVDADPIHMIQGRGLLLALGHRRATGGGL